MKKTLLALAALGLFAGAASAQSTVTIYGLLDLGVIHVNNGTSLGQNNGARSNSWSVNQGASSRLGFKGVEDLGGGMSAFFDIQHRFRPDTGTLTDANIFWQAQSFVGLRSAAAGEVRLGRDYAVAFWPAVKTDPWGWDTTAQLGGITWAGYGVRDGGIRNNNIVSYRTPNMGGFTAAGQIAPGEGSLNGGRAAGLNAEFSAGPVYVGFGWDKTNKVGVDSSLTLLAGSFDMGVAKIMGGYASNKTVANTKTTGIWVGGLVPIGAGTIKLGTAKQNPAGPNNDTTKIGAGYFYDLSKRTTVYTDVSRVKIATKSSQTNFDFGIRHTF
jgi:predicted porin